MNKDKSIEVTPQMIAAGVNALDLFSAESFGPNFLVQQIYIAMAQESLSLCDQAIAQIPSDTSSTLVGKS